MNKFDRCITKYINLWGNNMLLSYPKLQIFLKKQSRRSRSFLLTVVELASTTVGFWSNCSWLKFNCSRSENHKNLILKVLHNFFQKFQTDMFCKQNFIKFWQKKFFSTLRGIHKSWKEFFSMELMKFWY